MFQVNCAIHSTGPIVHRCEMRLSFGVQNVAGIEAGIRRLASAVRWVLDSQPEPVR